MRAAFIEQLGPPDNIRYGDLPGPTPGPTDVLVDVIATTVNPVDTFVRSGAFRTPIPLPFIVGRDLVGTVAATSPGTPGFAVGDLVWTNSLGHAGRQGAAAEQAVVAVDRLYHLPPGVSPQVAVTMVHPTATAYLALFTHGRLKAGHTVVVMGAAGNVGAALTVLAWHAGARVVATAADADLAYCRGLGAAEVIDYREPDLVGRLREACPEGIHLYLDTSGHNQLESVVDLLTFRGRIVLLAGAATRPVLPAGALYMNDRTVTGFVISHATVAELAEAATSINRLLTAGRLVPRTTDTVSLADLAQAHRQMEAGALHGKRLVVRTDLNR